VKDLAGNPLAEDKVWSFTTKPRRPPRPDHIVSAFRNLRNSSPYPPLSSSTLTQPPHAAAQKAQ
jgi:hypothetical protein